MKNFKNTDFVSLRAATILFSLSHTYFLWGRLVTCGRLAIGPIIFLIQNKADYQSAAGYQPAPHELRRSRAVPLKKILEPYIFLRSPSEDKEAIAREVAAEKNRQRTGV